MIAISILINKQGADKAPYFLTLYKHLRINHS